MKLLSRLLIIVSLLVPGAWAQCTGTTVKYIDTGNTCAWTGTDVFAQIASAYSALPANGGKIHIANGTYTAASTTVNFNTSGKKVILEGEGMATILQYNGSSGDVFTFNTGNGGVLVGSGMRDLKLVNTLGKSGAGTSRGVVVGGTNGESGFELISTYILNFNINVEEKDNTQDLYCRGCHLLDPKTSAYKSASGLTLAGENTKFEQCEVSNTTANTWTPKLIDIENGGEVFGISHCSVDNGEIYFSGGGRATIEDVHTEVSTNGPNSTAFVTNAGFEVVLMGNYFLQNGNTPPYNYAVETTGGNTIAIGDSVTSTTGTPSAAYRCSNSTSYLEVIAPKSFSGYTNLYSLSNSCVGQMLDPISGNNLVTSLAFAGDNGGTLHYNPDITFGAYMGTWTSLAEIGQFVPRKDITIERIDMSILTPGSGCSTLPSINVTDGTTAIGVSLTNGATHPAGAFSQSYAAGSTLKITTNTPVGCSVLPTATNVTVTYRMN